MRILHVTQSLDPAWGGIARVLPELASRLAGVGVSSRVACLRGDRFGTPPTFEKFDVEAFDANRRSPLGNSRSFNDAIEKLVADSDVVHLHGLWAGQNRTAGNAARRQSKPIVVTPHSMMMPWAWQRSAWKKRLVGIWFEHRNLRTASVLHALAKGEAAAMRDLGFNERIVVIPNGIEPSEFENLPDAVDLEQRFPEIAGKKWCLILGRIAEQKGIIPATEALAAIIGSFPDWQVVIAGPDPFGLIPRLKEIAESHRAESSFTFTGMLNRDDVMACLRRSALLVQPSFSEGLSMSILEALAAGLPALVAPGCNMPEIADAGAGMEVLPRPEEIETACRRFFEMSDDERENMSRGAKALARERFSWDVLIPKYRHMYENVISA